MKKIVFTSLNLFLWLRIALTIIGAFIILFGIYFFNLDMKLTSFLESKLVKIYDKRKKNKKI